MVRAEQALAIGLCDLVCDPGELLSRARKTALTIAAKGPLAIAAAKRVMQRGQSLALDDACDQESTAFSQLFGSRDQKEGMRAFLDKREPRFEGRRLVFGRPRLAAPRPGVGSEDRLRRGSQPPLWAQRRRLRRPQMHLAPLVVADPGRHRPVHQQLVRVELAVGLPRDP